MSAVTCEGIRKSFGKVHAVQGLDLTIPRGSVYGLLGRNGAGKSTTIRMLMDILAPDEGTIRIFGEPMGESVRDRIGYLPEERGLYPKMKVNDVLLFLAAIHRVPRAAAQPRIDRWLDRMDLAGWKDRKVQELSKGMQQKLQFVGTILHEPELVVLDEPFSGLDPVNVTLLKDILLELTRSGKTLIFSTHIMEQAEKLCESVCIIDRGRKVLDGALGAIKEHHGKNTVILSYDGSGAFLDDPDVARKDDYGHYVEVALRDGADPQRLLRRALEATRVSRFEVVQPSLNDIFIQQVGREP
ncbi:MAG: ATP-binding cassette domain-containing protein [Acidobacteriota bacterium]